MPPIRPNVIWAMDFQFDTTADGVVTVLDRRARTRSAPTYVRFDNGSKSVAHAVSDWCRFNSAGLLFIDPGSPWQNAWIELDHKRVPADVSAVGRLSTMPRQRPPGATARCGLAKRSR